MRLIDLCFYFSKRLCISFTGSASFENKLKPLPSTITGRPNIAIYNALNVAASQSSAMSRPSEQAEWQILAYLITLVDFVTNTKDAIPKYPQTTPAVQPRAFLTPLKIVYQLIRQQRPNHHQMWLPASRVDLYSGQVPPGVLRRAHFFFF